LPTSACGVFHRLPRHSRRKTN